MATQRKGLNNKLIIFLAILALILSFTARIDIHLTRMFGVVWNLGHIVAFYVWTYLFLKHVNKFQSLSFLKQFLFILTITILLGTGIEVVQAHIGRSAELGDLISDVIGSLLALSIHSPKRTELKPIALLSLKLSLIIAAMVLHRHLVWVPINEYYTHKQFPVLLNPAVPFEETKFDKTGAYEFKKINNADKHYFEIIFLPKLYSTVSINYFPIDWQGYTYLDIEIENAEDQTLNIVCRIHDMQHEDEEQEYTDRFNQAYTLSPGYNKIRIDVEKIKNAPIGRQMNLAQIDELELFTTQLKAMQTMRLLKIALVK